ncbi:MAG: asparaginase [Lentisphaerae bacterium GWF2_52_8]|nr:MAG: asparaginase [Lentisphaerae bacterium GWF2_52_8]
MKVLILATGGTFDKEYNELKGELYFKKTHLPEMLSLGRCRIPLKMQVLMMKDSLEMGDADRQQIADACLQAKQKRIVITHGTDTMEITARFLGPIISGKVVVLTGAMVPYRFGSSDGLFNLGGALAFAQTLEPGVYVAMNGRCLRWDTATKNRKKGIFEKRRLNHKMK